MNIVSMIESIRNTDVRLGCNQFSLSLIRKAAKCYDYEARLSVAEYLGCVEPSSETITILKQMIWDKDALVAAEACDSLGVKGNMDCVSALNKRFLCARSIIVRGYAIIASSEICFRFNMEKEEQVDFLLTLIKKEKNKWLLQNYYCAMCILGQKEYFEKLISGTKSKLPAIRSLSKSLLEFLENDIKTN